MIYKEPIDLSYARKIFPIEYEIDEKGCWACVSHSKDKDGYVKITRNKRQMRAHRYVYKLEYGEIPDDLVLLHICDNPACINPEHLQIGTQRDNQFDKIVKGRHAFGSRNGRAKLSEDAVAKIISDPRKYAEIAADYGISRETVSLIKRRKTWKDVG